MPANTTASRLCLLAATGARWISLLLMAAAERSPRPALLRRGKCANDFARRTLGGL
jgi:hypothetical protein